MSDETYNGWTNRETWALVLHLDNDESLQDWTHERIRGAFTLNDAADLLAAFVDDLFDQSFWKDDFGCEMPEGVHLMRSDVGSTWRIDWHEAAEHFLSGLDIEVCATCGSTYDEGDTCPDCPKEGS